MYKAIVTKIKTRPHPNADRLQLGTCAGFQVVVGLDTQDGELGVFFPTDGQLSDEFCKANNLYPVLDKDGRRVGGGFIDPKNRRVRAQSFRGEKSFGMWVPLIYFNYLRQSGISVNLSEGDTFDKIGDIQICNRYETLETRKGKSGKQKKENRRETLMFKMHQETDQFKYYKDDIKPDSLITITLKLHGTSGRYGHVLEDKPKRWYHKLFRIDPGREWVYLNGSRRVILGRSTGVGFYGDDSFREDVVHNLTLHKGETLYFEIVGWVNENTPIMPEVSTKELGKEFQKQYGETMLYKYGCPQGTRDIYVYRITMTNEDGISYDLPWSLVKRRCSELGLKHVPELLGTTKNKDIGFNTDLEAWVNYTTEGPDLIDPSHIREGVVVRVDDENGTKFYKNKSYEFYVMEGVVKDSGKEDIEESA